MRIICVFLIVSQLCFGQVNKVKLDVIRNDLKQYNGIKGNALKVNQNSFISVELFSEKNNYALANFRIVFYGKNKKKEILLDLGSIDGWNKSPEILIYENMLLNEKIIICVAEGEYFADINIFLFNKSEKMIHLGEISMETFAEANLEYFSFSTEIIEVSKSDWGFEILFKGKTYSLAEGIINSKRSGRVVSENLTLLYY